MSIHVCALPTKPEDVASDDPIRRTSEFHPSIWGDHFLSFTLDSEEMDAKTMKLVEELKKEVRRMVINGHGDDLSQKLYFIDAVQRLGVSYHFETEIEESLKHIHNKKSHDDSSCDLYTVALKFRLLRQQGYNVSSEVFNKFVDMGEFKESLVSDARGMLELYEATHMSIHGEDLLDRAQAFTTTNLKSCLGSELIGASLAEQVSHALKNPLHKSVPRLEHRYYIDTYQQDPSHNESLLAFAKLDFNILQKLHLKELSILTRWWKDLDFKTKLPYARDRLVELCLWILFVFYEPRYALGRRLATKVISMVSILDDTFDNYGTTEELEIFTKAMQRWDIGELDELPEYMHVIYVAILDVYGEIEEEMTREGKSYAFYHAKEAMKALVKAYFEETKWYKQDYTPSLEEYLSVSLVSSSHPLVITASFLGMGDFATKDAFDWLLTDPKSLKGSCIAGRLLDELFGVGGKSSPLLISHEFEQKRGHIASSVECYMKQYGVEEQDGVYGLKKIVVDAWKDINEDCLRPTAVPMPLLTRIMNCTRVCEEVYKTQDGYTNAHIVMKDLVIAMLVDAVPI